MNRRTWLTSLGLTLAAPTLARERPKDAATALDPARPWRLHANESPYGPSEAALAALRDAAADGALYPFDELTALTRAIAEREKVSPEQVIVASGSGEILCAAGIAWQARGSSIVAAECTFEQLPRYAAGAGLAIKRTPLDAALTHDLKAMAAAVDDDTALVYVCNPNNPTGTLVAPDRLDRLIDEVHERAVVFVDEAYVELQTDPTRHSVMDRVRQGDNVVISRTFSKLHGLAGLRVGYGIAPPNLAEDLRRTKMSLPNGPGLAAALASYRDTDRLAAVRRDVVTTRDWFAEQLTSRGWPCTSSAANFVFADLGRPIDPVRDAARAQGVLLGRPFSPYATRMRISVGTQDQMTKLVPLLEQWVT